MAHELEIARDGTASMAYNRTTGTPWHRLGTPVDGYGTIDEMLTASRADYAVRKSPAHVLDEFGQPVEVPGAYITTRRRPVVVDETGVSGGDLQGLGLVGRLQTVIQNREAAEFGYAIVDVLNSEALVDTMGVLEDGRTFFAYLLLPDTVIDEHGIADRMARGLGIITGHDGRRSLTVVNSVIRIVCMNTLQAALGSQLQITIRHTRNQDTTMAEVRRALHLRLAADDEFDAIAEGLLGAPATFGDVIKVADKLWGYDRDTKPSAAKATRHAARIDTMEDLWDQPQNDVGDNRWKALNVLTEVIDHHGNGAAYDKAERAILGRQDGRKARASKLLTV